MEGTKTITGARADAAARLASKRNKQVISKNCASLTELK